MPHAPDILQSTIQTVATLGQLAQNIAVQQQAAHHYRHKILLTETETALLLHVSKSFLREHRYSGTEPVYYKLGNNVRYDYFELMDYVDTCRYLTKVAGRA